MTVADCIKEYEQLGEKVFGHPRPPGVASIVTHKFDADDLKKAISEVTTRHGERMEDENSEVQFPSHEDLCKTSADLPPNSNNSANDALELLPLELIRVVLQYPSCSAHMIAKSNQLAQRTRR
jgi:hypothetical protein